MKKQVAVIGLGRFGSSIAKSLYNLGHDVLAIDKDPSRVQSIMGQATHAIAGDATDELVLRELGIHDYDVATVSIGTDIVASIMASVLLKTMGVPFVVSRARNDLHGNTLERVGVDRVIHAESEMGVRLAHSLFNPNVQEYLELTPNFGISKVLVPKRFVNMSLKELGFSSPRDKYGLAVLAIRRGKDITLNPDTDDRLQANDWLVLAGKDDLLDKLELVHDNGSSP
jgi:trk system potassium uptake protein TrkA